MRWQRGFFDRPVAAALVAQRRDLLGEIFRARPAARAAFLDIALVETGSLTSAPSASR
jgi:hypothetical protein